MHEFSLSFEKYKNKTAKQIDSVVRGTAIGLLGDIIYDTAVDSGRLRSNNQLSIDSEINTSLIETDKSGNNTLNKAINYLNTHKIGKYIYIQNNLEYAEKIEYGGSPKKAPNGFYRVNVARWRAKLS